MKIGIILNRVNYEEKQIITALTKAGHEVVQINNQRLMLDLRKKNNNVNKDFDNVELILQRSLSLMRGLYTTAIFEFKGKKVINNYESIKICGDKLLTTLKLEEHGIPTPKTSVAFTKDATLKALNESVKYPAVIKPIIGSWGRMIAKLDGDNMAASILEDRETMGNILQKIFYVQQYIGPNDRPKNAPTDIRVLNIGGDSIAAMGRIVQGSDFRSNIALGGRAVKLEIDNEMEKLCRKISKAVNGDILGIDLMKTNDGYICLEVNGTPQFRGLSNANDIDIGQKIVEYVKEKYI